MVCFSCQQCSNLVAITAMLIFLWNKSTPRVYVYEQVHDASVAMCYKGAHHRRQELPRQYNDIEQHICYPCSSPIARCL